MLRRSSSSSSTGGSPRGSRTNSGERQDFAPPNKKARQSRRGLSRRYSRGGSHQDQLGRGRSRSHDQRRPRDGRRSDETRYRGDRQPGGHDEGRRSRRDQDEDLHLAEAERQGEDMDESIYVMESGPSVSPAQSVASAAGSDCLEDQYCTEAVDKREGLVSAEGPAVDAKGDAENSGRKSVSGEMTANN